MNKFIKISDAENEVMEVIWRLEETTIPEAHKKLSENKKWAYNTVGTFMQRLCEKGLLECSKQGKTNKYRALISQEEYKKAVTFDFLQSIHKGSKKSLIASLFDGSLSDETIDEMMKLMEKE